MAVLLLVAVCLLSKEGAVLVSSMRAAEEKPCIVVDAGHGGDDPGKIGSHGELEKDRKATSYPGCLDGIPVGEYTEEPVAVDGHVVTSRGVGTAIAFALKLIEVLISKEKADEIAASIVYPV